MRAVPAGNMISGDHLVVALARADHRIDTGVRIDDDLDE